MPTYSRAFSINPRRRAKRVALLRLTSSALIGRQWGQIQTVDISASIYSPSVAFSNCRRRLSTKHFMSGLLASRSPNRRTACAPAGYFNPSIRRTTSARRYLPCRTATYITASRPQSRRPSSIVVHRRPRTFSARWTSASHSTRPARASRLVSAGSV